MKARSYQLEAVQSLFRYFREKFGNPLVCMPTGTGKSVVIALFLEMALRLYPGQRILVLTHVKELIVQNYSKFQQVWPGAPSGIYSSGLGKKEHYYPVTFAGIGSIIKQWMLFGRIDLILIDEAHLVSPNDATMYRKLIDELKKINPNLKVIGFTATPWRLGQGSLIGKDGLFTDICFDITSMGPFNRLIAEGYLSPLVAKPMKTILDVDGFHIRGGEFVEKEVQLAVDKNEITYAALQEAIELGQDRKSWLAYGSGIEHVMHITEMLNGLGVPAIAIHSKMGDAERDKGIKAFKQGKYRCAVNNNVLTTGFDHPPIDLIIGLRPSASSLLWVQMLGRGMRPYDPEFPGDVDPRIFSDKKHNCLVLDFARNTKRLGPVNDPVIPHKKGKGSGEAPVKECPVCETYNHASVRHCTACGHEFIFSVKIDTTASSQAILAGDLPLVEVFEVDHITAARHSKVGAADMLKLTYYCGTKAFPDYVCVEHTGYALHKAHEWWGTRTKDPFPKTVDEALDRIDKLPVPSHLRVWINKKHPQIMTYCFDGSGFGTVTPVPMRADVKVERPMVDTLRASQAERQGLRDSFDAKAAKHKPFEYDMDDDIPF